MGLAALARTRAVSTRRGARRPEGEVRVRDVSRELLQPRELRVGLGGEDFGAPSNDPPEDGVEEPPAVRVGVARGRRRELDEGARDAERSVTRRLADHLRLEESALGRRLAPDDLTRRDALGEQRPRGRPPALERRLDDDVSHTEMLSPGSVGAASGRPVRCRKVSGGETGPRST